MKSFWGEIHFERVICAYHGGVICDMHGWEYRGSSSLDKEYSSTTTTTEADTLLFSVPIYAQCESL